MRESTIELGHKSVDKFLFAKCLPNSKKNYCCPVKNKAAQKTIFNR